MRALRVVLAMESYLARLGARVTIVQGVVFVVCMLTFRRGVIGAISRFLKKPLSPWPQCGAAFLEPPPCGKLIPLPISKSRSSPQEIR